VAYLLWCFDRIGGETPLRQEHLAQIAQSAQPERYLARFCHSGSRAIAWVAGGDFWVLSTFCMRELYDLDFLERNRSLLLYTLENFAGTAVWLSLRFILHR
jgi:hypothetical protein